MQVLNRGGLNTVSPTENYALAFDFAPVKLSIAPAGEVVQVAWPVSASGFNLQATTSGNLTSGWGTASETPVVTNGQYVVRTVATNSQRFFRLFRP